MQKAKRSETKILEDSSRAEKSVSNDIDGGLLQREAAILNGNDQSAIFDRPPLSVQQLLDLNETPQKKIMTTDLCEELPELNEDEVEAMYNKKSKSNLSSVDGDEGRSERFTTPQTNV